MKKVIYMKGCEPQENNSLELAKFKKGLIEMARKEMSFNNSGLLPEVEREILSAKSNEDAESAFQRKLTFAITTYTRSGLEG